MRGDSENRSHTEENCLTINSGCIVIVGSCRLGNYIKQPADIDITY